MSIDRYNYEEYFLLYTDNELNEMQRKAVERFIEENPDLKQELTAFQQAICQPDENIEFESKQMLIDNVQREPGIDVHNCTEFFILYADNELDNEQKARVEEFVYHHPRYQEEFEMMLQLKMKPDRSIFFAEKESLMHYAGKARVVPLWWKFSAGIAAALILITFTVLEFNSGSFEEREGLVSLLTPGQALVHDGKLPVNKNLKEDIQPAPKPSRPVAEHSSRSESFQKDVAQTAVSIHEGASSTGAKPEPVKEKTASTSQAINVAAEQTNEPAAVDPNKRRQYEVPEVKLSSPVLSIREMPSTRPGNLALAVPVSQNEADDDFLLDQPDVRIAGFQVSSKSKLGGIIKKTSRFLNKNSNENSARSSLIIRGVQIALR